jgi:mannose/fructose-specific phosphotransferase system component IIA
VASVLLICHGGLAASLVDIAHMIVGASERAAPISFLPGMGPDDLSQAIDAALGTADERPPVLVLTDLAGGTPARVSAELLRTVRAEVVTGVNLPMLIEVLLADPNISVGHGEDGGKHRDRHRVDVAAQPAAADALVRSLGTGGSWRFPSPTPSPCR